MNPPRMLEVTREQWERMSAGEREGVSIIRTAAGVRLPVYHQFKMKGETNMNLTLILPSTHPEVQAGGLLAERSFDAGAVSIVVHSMLTHHERGNVTLNNTTPLLRIVSKNDPLSFSTEKQTVAEFTGIFAKALQDAEIHSMQVVKWINEQISAAIKQAVEMNLHNVRETIFPCASGHDWQKHIDPAKPSACSKCAAVRDNVTGEITYPDARGRFV